MARKTLLRVLKISMSFIMAWTAPAISYAAQSQTPQTQTGSGSGKPPNNNLPPTTYMDGGQQSDPQNGAHNGKRVAGKFGELWGKEASGTPILREGQLDESGHIRVFKNSSQTHSGNDSGYILRGRVVDVTEDSDGRVQWQGNWTKYSDLVQQLRNPKVAELPRANPLVNIPRVFLDPHFSGDNIFYQGQKGSSGHELVFRLRTVNGKPDYSAIETGTVLDNGDLQWDARAVDADRFFSNIKKIDLEKRSDLTPEQKIKFSQNIKKLQSESFKQWLESEVTKPTTPRSGDIFSKADGKIVNYEGTADANGRPLVWSYTEGVNGLEGQYQHGFVDIDGKVVWTKGPGSNYPAIQASSDPLPRNRAPVITDGKTTTTSLKPDGGRSEVNSPSKEAIPRNSARNSILHRVAQAASDAFGGTAAPATPTPVTAPPPVNTKVPITSDHSLVVTDGKIKTYEQPAKGDYTTGYQSGQNDVSSPQVERLSVAYKPSNLKQTLDWGADKVSQVDAILKKIAAGQQRPLDFQNPENNVAPDLSSSRTAQIGAGMAAFYVGMGIVAAFTIMHDYPNNPVALEKYMTTLTDPVGWMMMAGFMATAAPFLQKVGGFTSGKAVVHAVPMFAAAMLAGALVQGIMIYATDADVMACTGAKTYNSFHSQPRDLAACDRAYEKLSLEQVTLTFLPALTNLMAAGGIYLGVQFVSSVTGLTSALRALPVLAGPKGNVIGMVAGAVVFLGAYAIATNVVGAEKKTREFLIANHAIASNDYGATTPQAEANLYSGWQALKSRSWHDLPVPDFNKRCVYQDDFAGLQGNYSCPDPADFGGVLDRYAQLQNTWRSTQLAGTMASYNQWVQKVKAYHATMQSSYEAYQDFVSRIAYELQNPGLANFDARGFNAVTIRNLEHQRTDGATYPADPYASGFELAKGFGQVTKVAGDPIFSQDFSGAWGHVDTTKFYDFVVAAMACGPEGEGFGGTNSMWDKTMGYVQKWTTGNITPQSIVDDQYGSSVKFFPPRITKPLEGSTGSICQEFQGKPLFPSPVELISPSMKWPPQQFLVLAPFFSSKKSYHSLYEYILDNVRPTVISDGKNNFEKWWAETVGPQVVQEENKLFDEYAKMLNTTYKDALVRSDYYSCDQGESTGLDFTKYLVNLPSGATAPKCANIGIHHLAYGVVNSMRDEVRLYLAMLADIYVSSSLSQQQNSGYEKQVMDANRKLLQNFDTLMDKLTIVNPDERGDVNQASLAFGNSFSALRDLITAQIAVDEPANATARKLLMKIAALVSQADSYNSILTGIKHMDLTSPDSSDTTKAAVSAQDALVPTAAANDNAPSPTQEADHGL